MKRMRIIMIACLIVVVFFANPQKLVASEYVVTFFVNGGDKSSQPVPRVTTSGTVINLENVENPTRSGYEFIGWEYNNSIVSGTFTMPEADVHFVAKWQGQRQGLVFDFLLEAVQNKQEDYEVEPNSVIQTSTFLVPTHNRYTFLGWTINGTDIITEVVVRNGGLRIKAKWGGSYEDVRFDVAGGVAPPNLETRQMPVGEILDLAIIPEPTRKGYNFSGWTELDDTIVNQYVIKEHGTTFFAKWQEIADSLVINTQHIERIIEASTKKADIQQLFGVVAEDQYDGDVSDSLRYKIDGIDFSRVGTYTIEMSAKNLRKQQATKIVQLKIIDTTAPNIMISQQEVKLKIGDFRLSDYQKVFGVEIEDISAKNILPHFQEQDTVNRERPGKYNIEISAKDSYGNERKKMVVLIIEPLAISGTVFLDENYNSLKDDAQFLSNLSLQLVDADTNNVIQTTTTNLKGEYQFLSPTYSKKEKTITRFKVKAIFGSQYLPAHHVNTDSKFNVESKLTEVIIPSGEDITMIDLGLGKNIEITLPRPIVKLESGQKQVVDVLISNGKIFAAKGEDEGDLTVEIMQTGVTLMASHQKEQDLIIYFENCYGRESNITRKISIL